MNSIKTYYRLQYNFLTNMLLLLKFNVILLKEPVTVVQPN